MDRKNVSELIKARLSRIYQRPASRPAVMIAIFYEQQNFPKLSLFSKHIQRIIQNCSVLIHESETPLTAPKTRAGHA
jgi:hypothetical protein